MKVPYSPIHYAVLAFSLFYLPALAEEKAKWKETNSQAISAMRSENYEESERLFRKALKECPLDSDRDTVNTNLSLLMQKLGRDPQTGNLQGQIEKSPERFSTKQSVQTNANNSTTADRADGSQSKTGGIRAVIKDLDSEISKADAAGNLETLQALFEKKAEAIRIRDGCETLDYAYALHFRAQVLEHMHRDAEAEAIEARATHIRDTIRKIVTKPVHAPQKQRSSLGKLNMHFDIGDTPSSSYQERYPNPSSKSGSLDSAQKNTIDKNTTNIQKTQNANDMLNSERNNFGR